MPDYLLRQAFTQTLPFFADSPKQLATVTFAARSHSSSNALTHAGIGIVLVWSAVPFGLMIAQCSWRC
jgi:hypothetical protein